MRGAVVAVAVAVADEADGRIGGELVEEEERLVDGAEGQVGRGVDVEGVEVVVDGGHGAGPHPQRAGRRVAG